MPSQLKLSWITKQHEFYLSVLIIVLMLGLSMTTTDFFTVGNLFDMTVSSAILGILACGLFVVLVFGGIDISFPGMTAISQYITALYILHYGGNFYLAFAISIIVGFILGTVNALLVYRLKVPAIIITISTLNVWFGLLMYFSRGDWLYGFPEWFMNGVEWFTFTGSDGYQYGVSLPIIALIVVVACTSLLMNKTTLGRQIYAVGGNTESASRMGINIFRLHIFVYGFMGAVSGIAAVIQTQITQSVAPNSLMGFELIVLASVVLGGASMTGGKGRLIGVVLGVILLAIVKNGLTLLSIPSYWHTVLTGIIIVASISATAMNERKQASKGLAWK
ncbi:MULTISPECIES: ABC transporter permease [Vibrio]|uniref:Ribose transport system permease protein RbsC n=2 Tax=Vibrio TaxID=662 RepID=A0A1R4LDH4_VIBR1|nr:MULTISPECIES: ABC transporter permease [Vibrio]MDW6093232.1 ABC transporter permease [Vibrio rhizosphaerae]SJN54453.1 Ribose transport system permease protein RbsC [Vibrio ruber DSM 16370]